jgi:microcin C transport system substrate-binding protein
VWVAPPDAQALCCAPFIKNLGTLGIEATLRIVDPEQYRKRVDEFELTVRRFGFSSTPRDPVFSEL